MTDPRPADGPGLSARLAIRGAAASTSFLSFHERTFGFEKRESIDEDRMIMPVETAHHGQLIPMLVPEGAFGATTRMARGADPMAPWPLYRCGGDADARSPSQPRDPFRVARTEDLDGHRRPRARGIAR